MLHAGFAALVALVVLPLRAQGGCAPALHPWIAEILYDATGDDTGREFVELYNPHALPLPLAGVRLEAGDGSGPARWSLRWTGGAADTVPALGRFVIGGARVEPAPNAVAALDLQNGPDAVRLFWPDGVIEVIGYGALEFAEYACGSPAADAPSGQSLARLPDDADQGSNALDFRAAAPSPGRANLTRRDLAVVRGSLALDPEQPAPLAPSRLSATVVNAGQDAVTPREARVVAVAGADTVAVAVLDAGLGAGDSVRTAVDLPALPSGKLVLRLAAVLAGDEAPGNDADSLPIRIGPGALEITEIQFHPAAGEGEWVEVRNRGRVAFAPAEARLSDRNGTPGLPSGSASLPPDSLAVLVQNRPALLARYPDLDTTRVWAAAPWPSLNNSDGADGVADAVVLREADGTLIERVEYSARAAPAGVPIERAEGGVWVAAADPAGTPLVAPRPVVPAAGGFEIEPRLVPRDGRGLLRWALPWARARVSCQLYDLAGRSRGTVLEETLVPGRAEHGWSAPDLGAGFYVMVLRARPENGDEVFTATRALRIGGRR